jgi:hypothetical protein
LAVADTPGIPRTHSGNPELDQALNAIIETLDIREGRHGHPLDRMVTRRDLVDIGVAELARPTGADDGTLQAPTEEEDLGPAPVQPDGVAASGGFGRIVISWTSPEYGTHAYTEVHRADHDNLGAAVLAGSSRGLSWTDGSLPQHATRYYWVRHVSSTGRKGPFSEAVSATTVYEPDQLHTATAEEIGSTDLYSALQGASRDVESAQYLVRVGHEGVSAGFGIGVEGGKSRFIALADQFAIGNPGASDPTQKEAFPFIVSDADGDGDQEVLIDTAFIGEATITDAHIETLNANKIVADDGTEGVDAIIGEATIDWAQITNAEIDWATITGVNITRADIGEAEVDSINIAGHAVTVPSSGSSESVRILHNDYPKVVARTDFELDEPSDVLVFVSTIIRIGEGSGDASWTKADVKTAINCGGVYLIGEGGAETINQATTGWHPFSMQSLARNVGAGRRSAAFEIGIRGRHGYAYKSNITVLAAKR